MVSLFGHSQVVNGFTASNRLITPSPDPVNNAATANPIKGIQPQFVIRNLFQQVFTSLIFRGRTRRKGVQTFRSRGWPLTYSRSDNVPCNLPATLEFFGKIPSALRLICSRDIFAKASDDPISLTSSFINSKAYAKIPATRCLSKPLMACAVPIALIVMSEKRQLPLPIHSAPLGV